jgi:hypothetical protein
MTGDDMSPTWCKVCRHSHYSEFKGTLCGAVRWELVGMDWTPVDCWCRGEPQPVRTSSTGVA